MDFKKIFLLLILFLHMPVFGIEESDFWHNFNDCNLNYFIQRGMETNIDIKKNAINSEIYKNYIKIANSNRLPNMQIGANPAFLKQEGKKSFDWNYSFPLQVNYEIDIFLKNRDKTNLSKKDYEISLLNEQSEKISIASTIASVYFNTIKTDKSIELQEKILDLREKIYKLNTIGHAKGQVSVQDVIVSDKTLKNARIELEELKKTRDRLVFNMAVLIGTTPDETKDIVRSDIDNINYNGIIPMNIESYEITSRPDYKIAEKNVERAGIDIRIAKKEFLPTVNLTGLMTFNANDFGNIFNTKSALLNLGAIVAGDLFSGGKKMSGLKIKKLNYETALQEYEKVNLIALQEVNDALASIKYDSEKLDKTKEHNNLEKKDYNIYKKRFETGIIGSLDLLKAEENLLASEKLIANSKADCFIDYISLYKALGAKIPNS